MYMRKFEHFAYSCRPYLNGPIFNGSVNPNFGKDGWELVNVIHLPTPSGRYEAVYYFKREVYETNTTS